MRNLTIISAMFGWRKFPVRSLATAAEAVKPNDSKHIYSKMAAYQIHSYGNNIEELQFNRNAKKPHIKMPSEVLVKVHASSVNPIDLAMTNGYGSSLLNVMRCNSSDIEFPLTLGRDFVGTVVHKGLGIKQSDLKIGDKIWGVVPVHLQGCHAEYVCIDKCYVSKKPEQLSDIDAAAVLYAGLTAWSGLLITGQLGGLMGALCPHSGNRGKKVLVLGGSGGVGSLAIQILIAEGCEVVTTCSSDAIGLIKNLGIEKVIDYTSDECDGTLIHESPYDIILDCAGKGSDYAAALPWTFRNYVTFSSPLLKNFDQYGLVAGGIRNARGLITQNLSALSGQGSVKWGYFMPSQTGIEYLKNLVENRKLLPIIDSTFTFDTLVEAYQRVQDGHLRGKVVVDYTN